MHSFDLNGKVAVVTGGGQGIGEGIAKNLAAAGASVVVAARHVDRVQRVVDEIVADGGQALAVPTDVTHRAALVALADAAIETFGGLHVWVNNAGGSRPRDAAAGDADDAWWDEAFALNFTSARRITEGLLPGMKSAGWGRIITLTGAMTQRRINAASPAKAALWSWSRSLSAEVAAHGITVNCIAPGRISTPQIVNRLFPTEAARKAEIDASIPMGRFGEPEELAALVAFLASEPAGYITGAQIPVDGGMIRMAMP